MGCNNNCNCGCGNNGRGFFFDGCETFWIVVIIAIVIIWGGLAVSITALISRGRREDRDARAEASARAREHMLHPEQTD